MADPQWTWDRKTARYRDPKTGKFLSLDQVRTWVNQSISASQDVSAGLGSAAAGGALDVQTLEERLREEIKREYIRQYLLGIGGEQAMTPADWGSVGGMIAEQYGHLSDFMYEISEGHLTDAQIQARINMYMNSAREAFERAQAKANKKAEKKEEAWMLGEAEHCEDCLAFAGEGWQKIGYFPLPGSGRTVCKTNCKCHKEYR